jgi:UDPglucose 6-dehydrogenase
MAQARPLLPAGVALMPDAAATLRGADAMVLVTEWNEFRALDPALLKALMRGNVIVDLRNVFDPKTMRDHGFAYFGIGRS